MANRFLSAPLFHGFDNNGDPLKAGQLFTFDPGGEVERATYPTIADADNAENPNTNPVILDSRGEAAVVPVGNTKFVLKDSAGVTIWTLDNVDLANVDEIVDANGNEALIIVTTGSAVNEFSLTNAATGTAPKLSVTGGDTNVSFQVQPKGSGVFVVLDGNGNEIFTTQAGTASAVNHISVDNAATGNAPKVLAEGDDTDINLQAQPKGDGVVELLDGNGNEVLTTQVGTASAVNFLQVTNSSTASGPIVAAAGDDTNVALNLRGKGTGDVIILGTSTASAALRFNEDTDNGTNYVAITVTSGLSINTTMTLPTVNDTFAGIGAAQTLTNKTLTNPKISSIHDSTSTEAIAIDSTGAVTKPNQPAFSAGLSTDQDDKTGQGEAFTVIFDSELFDRNSDYNNATGIFTAPITGIYFLSAKVTVDTVVLSGETTLKIQTSNRNYTRNVERAQAQLADKDSHQLVVLADMDVGDTAFVTIAVASQTALVVDIIGGAVGETTFMGYLVA